MEEHSQFGFVYSDGQTFYEKNIETPVSDIIAKIPQNGYMFKNVLLGNVVYNPCGYMLRMSAFLDVNPQKEIYPSRYGQNIQMLMPISYKYRCGHLKEKLYGRVDREGSLSKKVWNEDDTAWRNRVLGLEEIYVENLKRIGGEALAYIPYIYYRNHRILAAISQNVGKKAYSMQRKTLKISTKMLIVEIIKTFLKRR